MASISAEEKLAYLLTVLKHTELPQPNYHAVAIEKAINNANNAQKKFKAIVESAGYRLVNKQIVDGISVPTAAAVQQKPTAAPKKMAGTKKRVAEEKSSGVKDGQVKKLKAQVVEDERADED